MKVSTFNARFNELLHFSVPVQVLDRAIVTVTVFSSRGGVSNRAVAAPGHSLGMVCLVCQAEQELEVGRITLRVLNYGRLATVLPSVYTLAPCQTDIS